MKKHFLRKSRTKIRIKNVHPRLDNETRCWSTDIRFQKIFCIQWWISPNPRDVKYKIWICLNYLIVMKQKRWLWVKYAIWIISKGQISPFGTRTPFCWLNQFWRCNKCSFFASKLSHLSGRWKHFPCFFTPLSTFKYLPVSLFCPWERRTLNNLNLIWNA